ncbi:GNAT family N-acetyltransferase [Pelomonas sp. APW6]|uniref:GNAT family N-acetyltransferase n=1 Tax=Roseateles subflavus TaxID=3053353 RepID=A0ABT7LPA5_9BURK|nr:GNAT family N-acetyltransferase [Pelomonas sp. APW6]MDL5033985.1 GNAT family N-acetyltransferase [Pelomonas sp. APW6]
MSCFQTEPWFRLMATRGLGGQGTPVRFSSPAGQGAGLSLWLCRHDRPVAPAGARLTALGNFYTPRFGPVVDAESPPWASREALAAAVQLGTQLRGDPAGAVLSLQPLQADSDELRLLQQGLQAAGYRTDVYHCFENWVLRCEGLRFETFWATRSSRLRNTERRARKRLAAEQALEIEIVRSPGPALERALEDFEAVYADSWKQAEARPDFIRALAQQMAEDGRLRLGVLRLQGVAQAAQLWWVHEGVASIYKLAYRESAAKLGVGTVLSATLFREALDSGEVRLIDYLNGSEPYKRDWVDERRDFVGLVAFDLRRPAAWGPALRHFGARWLKGVLKRLRPHKAGAAADDAAQDGA